MKQSRLREYVQRPQVELISLLRMGKFDDARKYLEELRLIIRKAGRVKFLTVAGERLKWIQTLEVIRKYFGDVDRKSLEEVSQHLTMNIIDLVELLASANEIFPGFKIEGRDLVLEASWEVGGFIDQLEREFQKWDSKERRKEKLL